MNMVPMIRNILGGFLFSGDDVYKKVRVLSGGERTRLAVARMLLRPSNTLLLDEPTNHLDLDSKDVLLDALVDYGGTLIFVSHDRYFVERLATKIIEINGSGDAVVYPGTYTEFLWHKEHGGPRGRRPWLQATAARTSRAANAEGDASPGQIGARRLDSRGRTPATAERFRQKPTARRKEAAGCRRAQGNRASCRLAGRGSTSWKPGSRNARQRCARSRHQMAAPGFYEDHAAAQPVIDQASGADVAARRPDAPVGRAPVRRRPRHRSLTKS